MPKYITLKTVRPLGWVVLLGCFGAAGFAFRGGEFWPGVWFIVFSLLGVYLLIGAYGRYALDTENLYAITPLGWHYRMAWAEVQYVEFGTSGTLVFHGTNKRFVMPPPAFWHGESKPAMYKLLVEQFEARKITPVPSNTADYRWNKNVRIDNAA